MRRLRRAVHHRVSNAEKETSMHLPLQRCRICGNRNLIPILDLGDQCLTGVFPRDVSQQVTRGPLKLLKCMESDPAKFCGLVQLDRSYPAGEMYGETYGYHSGLNRSMVDHLGRKVETLLSLIDLQKDDLVLDIGANDGTLLSYYPPDGPTVLGMDPSAGKFRHGYRPGIELIVDFFSAERYRRFAGDRKAKIVTSIAMFYDLENPQSFVDDIASILADDGIWHFEQSYLPLMLKTHSYDTVCHEHVEYYALRQVQWLLHRAGMHVIDVAENNINGGSFAITAAKVDGTIKPRADAVNAMIREEAGLGLDTLEPFERFAHEAAQHRADFRALLEDLRKQGRKVFGYGASTKGNVILQYCKITPDLLPCIAEVNKEKFGCVTPGTGIPIVSEAAAKAQNPDCFLVLPWHFRENILAREAAFRKSGGKMIFPLPKVEIV
jgi:cyclopropane fatty-acyl-phospholipid synthase-like methyltransferase